MTDYNLRQPGEDEVKFEPSGKYDDETGEPLWKRTRVAANDAGEFRSVGKALADWRVMHPVLAGPVSPERADTLAEELLGECGDGVEVGYVNDGEQRSEAYTVLPPYLVKRGAP